MKAKKHRVHEPMPNYHEAGKTYLPDNCRPLIEAAKAGHLTLNAVGRASYPGTRLAANRLPGLCSIGCWNAGPNQKWGLPLHRNEGIEISFLASGQTPTTIQGKPVVLSRDEFMITRPWQPHQIGDPHVGACKLIWLIIDVGVRHPHQAWKWPDWVVLERRDLEMLTSFLRQNERLTWPASCEMRHCFLSLANDLETNMLSSGLSRMAVRINELLIGLLEIFQRQNMLLRKTLTSAERTVHLFLQELDATLEHMWTLETMAASCHLGVTRFVHYFRRLTNTTPINYLNHARIQKACKILASRSDASITDIGFTCGFSSSQYFTNVFRKQTRRSPREYRALALLNHRHSSKSYKK